MLFFALASVEAFCCDLAAVARKLRYREDAFDLAFHHRLPRVVIAAPAAEDPHDAGGDLRVQGIEFDDLISEEAVACTVLPMKASGVGHGEDADQRAHTVGVGHLEGGVGLELSDLIQAVLALGHGLECEPFVDHQRLILPAFIETSEGVATSRMITVGK